VEETAASSANPAAKFFFDFFISRPLGQASASTDPLGPAYRWWGDVRIASMPLQTSAPLSSLAANLAQQARSLTLNELAQTGEFQTGLEWQWPRGRGGPFSPMLHDREWTALGFTVGLGAAKPFNAPNAPQIFRQWQAGLRLTSLLEDGARPLHSLGTVSLTLGQNELVTAGYLRGLVVQADAAYPLPISLGNLKLGALYIFGRAAVPLARSGSPSRDLYAIGFGADAIGFVRNLFNEINAAQTATTAPSR
jgi:hypothetical protein